MGHFRTLPTLSAILLLGAMAGAPAWAASSAASSASDSASDSSGSISKSSDSSSGDKKVAAGDYKVIDVAAVAGRPRMVRVQLAAAAEGGKTFFVTLPRVAAENGHLAEGQVVTAKARPYGIELLAAADEKAFFLLVEDDWHKELASHPVTL